MKAKKALKRLTKIESLMSAVTQRYSANAPHVRRALKDALDAITRAKQDVSVQASSGTKAAIEKPGQAAKQAAPAQKNAGVKHMSAKARRAKPARKKALKKTASKRTARKVRSAPVVQEETEPVLKYRVQRHRWCSRLPDGAAAFRLPRWPCTRLGPEVQREWKPFLKPADRRLLPLRLSHAPGRCRR